MTDDNKRHGTRWCHVFGVIIHIEIPSNSEEIPWFLYRRFRIYQIAFGYYLQISSNACHLLISALCIIKHQRYDYYQYPLRNILYTAWEF